MNGTNGAPGASGANGVSSYTHVAYADSANGSVDFTTGVPGARRYIGIHVGATAADPTDYSVYTWSRLTGENGLNGANGTAGPSGANGQTSYVHFAYSNAANGSVDFSTTDPNGRAYIGIYTDFTIADSTNPAAYTWSLAKGSDGSDGADGANGANGANGASAYTLLNVANTTVGVSSVVKTAGGNGWNGKAYTAQGFAQATVTGRLVSQGTFIGLDNDPGTDAGYATIEYALHCSEDGYVYRFHNGNVRQVLAGGYGSTFSVTCDGKMVRYVMNTILIDDLPVANPALVLHGAFAIYRVGQTIDQIGFAASGQAGANGSNGAPGANGSDGSPGPQGPPGISAPQPKQVNSTLTQLDPILVESGTTVALSSHVIVGSNNNQGAVTAQIQVAINDGGYTVVQSGSGYVYLGEPDGIDVQGNYTNTAGGSVFLSVRLVLSGPNGLYIQTNSGNYLRAN